MKIEDGEIKPCSKCYKARQLAKDAAALLSLKKRAEQVKVVTTLGEIIINTKDRTVASVWPRPEAPEGWADFIGRRVYLAGKSVIDVAKAARIKAFGDIVRSFPVDAVPDAD